jgi:hypothetical protein
MDIFVFETPSSLAPATPRTPHQVQEHLEQHLHFSPCKENISPSSTRPNPQVPRGCPPKPGSRKRKAREACLSDNGQLPMGHQALTLLAVYRPVKAFSFMGLALSESPVCVFQPYTSLLLIGIMFCCSKSLSVTPGCRAC